MSPLAACPHCGHSIPAESTTCRLCQTPLGQGWAPTPPPLVVQWGDALLAFLRSRLDAAFFDANVRALQAATPWATLVSAALGLLLAMYASLKTDSLALLVAGVAWVVIVGISYYIGARFVTACERVVLNSRSAVSSRVTFDVIGLLTFLAAVAALGWGVYAAIDSSEFQPLIVGFLVAISQVYGIAMALNLELVATEIDETATAGADFVANFQFFIRYLVRLSPVVMGSLVIWGALDGMLDVFEMLQEGYGVYGLAAGGFTEMKFVGQTLFGLLYPAVAYLLFIIAYLSSDLIMAILKLHRLPAR